MTPEQSRAARAWLDWSQDDLADAAKVSQSTVRDFEKGRRAPIPNNLAAMKAALERQGMKFVDGGLLREVATVSMDGETRASERLKAVPLD